MSSLSSFKMSCMQEICLDWKELTVLLLTSCLSLALPTTCFSLPTMQLKTDYHPGNGDLNKIWFTLLQYINHWG